MSADPPPTSSTTLSNYFWERKTFTWHVTDYRLQVTRDRSQNFSSPALMVCELQCFEDWEQKDDFLLLKYLRWSKFSGWYLYNRIFVLSFLQNFGKIEIWAPTKSTIVFLIKCLGHSLTQLIYELQKCL